MFGKLGGTAQRYCSSFATPFECWQDRTITEQIRLMFIKCIDSKRSVGMTRRHDFSTAFNAGVCQYYSRFPGLGRFAGLDSIWG